MYYLQGLAQVVGLQSIKCVVVGEKQTPCCLGREDCILEDSPSAKPAKGRGRKQFWSRPFSKECSLVPENFPQIGGASMQSRRGRKRALTWLRSSQDQLPYQYGET
jgi:hypothetical protein